MNYCIDCGKTVFKSQSRCKSCAKKGSLNNSYTTGITLKLYYCSECDKQLSGYQTKTGKCGSCAAKARVRPGNYKDGRTLKPKFCSCGTPITYRAIRCPRCETQRRLKENIWQRTKNIPETKLEILLSKILPTEYTFVGDNSLVVDKFNPDFVNKDNTKLIEMFGDYWHNLPRVKKRDYYRFKIYKQHQYKCLVVWEHELENEFDLTKKLLQFHLK